MSGPKGPPATIAGGPSKRLPRPPRDPWRRGNKEVSRARCALCAPAYAPPRAPSVRRNDPPRAHCCPRRPMLSTSSAATPSWTRSRLGASETNETKLFIGATRAVPAWDGARERVTAAALQQLRERAWRVSWHVQGVRVDGRLGARYAAFIFVGRKGAHGCARGCGKQCMAM